MRSKATSVAQYISELPADLRQAIESVRKVILQNLDQDIEEGAGEKHLEEGREEEGAFVGWRPECATLRR